MAVGLPLPGLWLMFLDMSPATTKAGVLSHKQPAVTMLQCTEQEAITATGEANQLVGNLEDRR